MLMLDQIYAGLKLFGEVKDRLTESSEKFRFTNTSTIAASGTITIHFETENARSGKYLPLKQVVVYNNSSEDIKVNDARTVPSGSEVELNELYHVKIENLGTSNISANEIVIVCQGEKTRWF